MDFLGGGSLELGLLWDFAIALLIGALIGVEREQRQEGAPSHFGGLRTFTLLAIAGAAAGHVSASVGNLWIFVAGLIGVCTLVGIAYYLAGAISKETPGLTTEVAAIVTYLLGGMALLEMQEIAIVLAIATTALLAFKQDLHTVVKGIGRDDIVAGLKLAFATFIILPILPNEALDPWGALNPYKLWLLVILISALSLIGYVAVRIMGERRGMALTGFFGGLVSSTAVTLTFAKRSKEPGAVADALALGLLLAWGVMFVRVVIEVAVVHPPLVRSVAGPMAAMFLASAAVTAVLYRRANRAGVPDDATPAAEHEDVPLENPFNLTSAIKFGLVFAAVLLIVELTQSWVSEEWLYGVAALAGTTDVDAITLSLADQATRGLSETTATLGILIGALSNTAVKCGMAISLGSPALGRRVGVASGIIAAAGIAAFVVQLLL
ncbi:MAG: MgtC/SapB family protein [Deltaproteobacteria bacterium]|nr:MgtC/SapB family protein [Deltaproteobacteria bacterium]